MGPWQTGREGAWSLAKREGSLGGGSGGVMRDPGLKGRGRRKKRRSEKPGQKCEKCTMKTTMNRGAVLFFQLN